MCNVNWEQIDDWRDLYEVDDDVPEGRLAEEWGDDDDSGDGGRPVAPPPA